MSLSDNPSYSELKKADEAHQQHGFGHPIMQKAPRQLVVFDSGNGAVLKDVQGQEYIDAMAGITVSHLGHARDDLAKVASEQISKLEVSSNQRNLTNVNAIKLCDRLSKLAEQAFPEKMTGARVFLHTGGAEGIEAAYHLALRFWNKSGPLGTSAGGGYKRQKVVSFRNCYHGSTFIPASMKPEFTDYGFQRWMEGEDESVKLSNPHKMFLHIDPPHELFLDKAKMEPWENVAQAAARQLDEVISGADPETVAAFFFEPVQGDGGAVHMHRDFFPLAEKICKKYGVLMVADEIMAFAKTGHWFGMELYGVSPDIMVVSKGVTSGYQPMGAVIYSDTIWKTAFNNPSTKLMLSDIWQHDYTWSGHPVYSAVALRMLDIIESEGLIHKAAERGKTFLDMLRKKLQGLHVVQQVRGTGVMLGVDLISDIAMDVEQKALLEYNVIVRASSNKHCILMTPPYVMTDEQFERVADVLYKVMSSMATLAESAISKSRQH